MSITGMTPPTRLAAVQAVSAIRPDDYARTRNHLMGAVTGLSPYLTHGVLTLREVLAEVLSKQPLAVGHKLVYEFGWREFFRHVWSHEGDGVFQSLHPGPLPDASYAQELPADIRRGTTGVPVVDEAVLTLYSTGTLHNHARMWLASYVVHIRRVHWRAGADWLATHLLDGDLASNHLSWQWVAGTGSHKPYLFNAESVARFAPPHWHSPGSVLDRSYEELDAVARSTRSDLVTPYLSTSLEPSRGMSTSEPPLLTMPPADLGVGSADSVTLVQLRGREVWLVHPWALRLPPSDLSHDAVVIGVYLREFHAAWPWSEARWRWVDAAMSEVAVNRWFMDAQGLAAALKHAVRVRALADPHIAQWLQPFVQLDAAPALFPTVDRRCLSFSQWWKRATRSYQNADELL
jgi:deoxyribodipyrimidine photo-lyase